MINTEEQAINALQALNKTLCELEKPKDLNFFEAAGLTTQEVKHSAFFAWLLNPKQTHNKGCLFLSDFLQSLYDFDSENEVPSNAEILSQTLTFAELTAFANADDIIVETEKVIDNPESRIDIFLKSEKTKTVFVIENKVFTSTHDDQLRRYCEEVAKLETGGCLKKIFVYLTPFGEVPKDIDGNYQSNWCIIDYGTIIKNLKSRIGKLQNAKLKCFIEDYISMVDNRILHNNPTIRELCKKIRREHSDALEILLNYADNVDMAYKYIATEWLPQNIPDISELIYSGRKLVFVTKAVSDYYAENQTDIKVNEEIYRLQISVTSKDGPVMITVWLSKEKDEEWSEADKKIRDILQPKKAMGAKYCTLYSHTLLTVEEREKVFDEDRDLYALLSGRLGQFLTKLHQFERQLAEL
ncbi:MAG: PD-(D/E)XK nuclease family protein [Candidatus Coproplasma sp.]